LYAECAAECLDGGPGRLTNALFKFSDTEAVQPGALGEFGLGQAGFLAQFFQPVRE
jgi:hypothetical protein